MKHQSKKFSQDSISNPFVYPIPLNSSAIITISSATTLLFTFNTKPVKIFTVCCKNKIKLIQMALKKYCRNKGALSKTPQKVF